MPSPRRVLSLLLVAAPMALFACATKPAAPATPAGAATDPETTAKLAAALAGPHRADANRARDSYRHPMETLTFFGLRDDQTVIELWPGGGWYTEILAPVLKNKGTLRVTSFDPKGPPDDYNTKGAQHLQTLLAKNAALFGTVDVIPVDPPGKLELGAPASADLVMTFRNLHNWMGDKIAEKLMASAFAVLKPGGVLGVVEHRAKPGQSVDSGYVEEGVAIKLAEGAGFKLAGRSEVNANPKDTKDYPDGVWSLPPSLEGKEADRAKYVAIGESDRMTLKFVKP